MLTETIYDIGLLPRAFRDHCLACNIPHVAGKPLVAGNRKPDLQEDLADPTRREILSQDRFILLGDLTYNAATSGLTVFLGPKVWQVCLCNYTNLNF